MSRVAPDAKQDVHEKTSDILPQLFPMPVTATPSPWIEIGMHFRVVPRLLHCTVLADTAVFDGSFVFRASIDHISLMYIDVYYFDLSQLLDSFQIDFQGILPCTVLIVITGQAQTSVAHGNQRHFSNVFLCFLG